MHYLSAKHVLSDRLLEVEVGIGPLSWAQIDPVDAGTRRVVTDGCRILHDPDGQLQRLLVACGVK